MRSAWPRPGAAPDHVVLETTGIAEPEAIHAQWRRRRRPSRPGAQGPVAARAVSAPTGGIELASAGVMANDTSAHDPLTGMRWLQRAVVATSAGVLIAAIVYAAYAADAHRGHAALGAALLALGAAAGGSVIGFLFGIPVSAVAIAQKPAAGGEAPAPREATRGANQLVQVAEWLTRIFIGATVTQLAAVRDQIAELAENASWQLLGSHRGIVVLGAILVYALVFGFYVGHVSTRLILNLIFDAVERPAISDAARREVLQAAHGGDGKLTSISPAVARAVVAVDAAGLSSSEDLQAWGLARAALDRTTPGADPSRAIDALERAVRGNPGDRRAVESLVLAALYAAPPEGFRRAIAEATAFLARGSAPTRADANLHAYLACGHGQAFAAAAAGAPERTAHAAAALAAARTAIELDPDWLAGLRRFATPGGVDDDLVAVARESSELRALLAIP